MEGPRQTAFVSVSFMKLINKPTGDVRHKIGWGVHITGPSSTVVVHIDNGGFDNNVEDGVCVICYLTAKFEFGNFEDTWILISSALTDNTPSMTSEAEACAVQLEDELSRKMVDVFNELFFCNLRTLKVEDDLSGLSDMIETRVTYECVMFYKITEYMTLIWELLPTDMFTMAEKQLLWLVYDSNNTDEIVFKIHKIKEGKLTEEEMETAKADVIRLARTAAVRV